MPDYKRISHIRCSPVEIDLNPENPRLAGRGFDGDTAHLGDLTSMARSIAEFGVRLPVAVRKIGDRYQSVDGDCRIAACRMVAEDPALLAIWNEKNGDKPVEIDAFAVPADYTAEQIDEVSTMLNSQRSEMTLFAQVEAFKRFRDRGKTQEEIAVLLNLSRASVSHFTAVASLPEKLAALVAADKLEITAILQFRKASEEARALIEHEIDPARSEALPQKKMMALIEHAESRIKAGLNVAEVTGTEPPEVGKPKKLKPSKAKPRDAKALMRTVIKPVLKSDDDTPLRQVMVALSLYLKGEMDHVALVEALQRNLRVADREAMAEAA